MPPIQGRETDEGGSTLIPKQLPLNRLIALSVLLVSSAGCQYMSGDGPPGSVQFQDDFTLASSGWDRYRDETYSVNYDQGGYRIQIFTPNTDAWANPRLNFEDVRIEVDATKLSGPDNNVFGVLCRYQDARNFYFFLASSDGYMGIGVYKEGRRVLLSGDSLLPHEAVRRGNATNHIRADCVDFNLSLWINGIPVAEAQAAEWNEGDVGLIAGSYETAGVEILFDQFSVLLPDHGGEG